LDTTFLVADARDIGRMKLMAIGSRGNRKDFVDLYCLTRQTIFLDTLLRLAMEENKGVSYSKTLFLKGLVDFEEADADELVNVIWDVGWDDIKRVLTHEVKDIAKSI
ncbi:nucleotidyl transferase AbiEii/AbiGii toxin family protein, partial [bacterium]|nr:nucleotidyl transferase AbiEii/AbiGii toxin family protein [bacterium]